jgi:predicted TIM-barrel fold metal-dependent hydrolase
MDDAGIDLRVISHGPPGSQGLREDVAVAWTRAANDRLHAAVQNHPTRFAGFASLPTAYPLAADELERAVTKLGFKGGVLHSLTEGPFLDDKRYWRVSKNVLYYYFKSKEGLFVAVLEQMYQDLRDHQQDLSVRAGDPRAAMKQLVHHTFYASRRAIRAPSG